MTDRNWSNAHKLPWRVEPYGEENDSGLCIGNDSVNVCVVPGYQDHPGNIANAEYIALACNSHPDLVEALEGILAITDRNHVAWDKARSALNKARGGSP